MVRKAASVLSAMLVLSSPAFAADAPAQAPLAPAGAAGLQAAQQFVPDNKIFVVAAVGLVIGAVLLIRSNYHNPAQPDVPKSGSTSGTH